MRFVVGFVPALEQLIRLQHGVTGTYGRRSEDTRRSGHCGSRPPLLCSRATRPCHLGLYGALWRTPNSAAAIFDRSLANKPQVYYCPARSVDILRTLRQLAGS